jgi:hypothetical protein
MPRILLVVFLGRSLKKRRRKWLKQGLATEGHLMNVTEGGLMRWITLAVEEVEAEVEEVGAWGGAWAEVRMIGDQETVDGAVELNDTFDYCSRPLVDKNLVHAPGPARPLSVAALSPLVVRVHAHQFTSVLLSLAHTARLLEDELHLAPLVPDLHRPVV